MIYFNFFASASALHTHICCVSHRKNRLYFIYAWAHVREQIFSTHRRQCCLLCFQFFFGPCATVRKHIQCIRVWLCVCVFVAQIIHGAHNDTAIIHFRFCLCWIPERKLLSPFYEIRRIKNLCLFYEKWIKIVASKFILATSIHSISSASALVAQILADIHNACRWEIAKFSSFYVISTFPSK